MPRNLGHRRAHSYFSGLVTATAPVPFKSNLSKAKSTDELSEQRIEPAKRATSARDLSNLHTDTSSSSSPQLQNSHLVEACKLQFEEELEQKVQSLVSKKKYREVVVPNSIKFAVVRPSASAAAAAAANSGTMARPRSPKSSYSSETDLLDQTLLNIRKRLTSLNSDRIEMENKMNDLMSGIKDVHVQCQNQLQNNISASSIRRVKSSANAARRPSNLSVTRIEELNNRDLLNSRVEHCSQDSVDLSQDSTISASSSQGSSSAAPVLRQRSESASATIRLFKPPTLTVQRCSVAEETCWLPAATIHELPESPKFTPLSQSSASLLSYSPLPPTCTPASTITTGSSSAYRRSFSVSSPPSCSPTPQTHATMVTSTPNVSQTPDKYFHTLPGFSASHRHSFNENSIIPEDEVDFGCKTESLSQLSTYTDEGSPKNGSTSGLIVTRRSSLTGQIEQYSKPRSTRNSKDLSEVAPTQDPRSPPNYATWTKGDSGYRVLNRGFRKSMKKKPARISQIILPGVETTV